MGMPNNNEEREKADKRRLRFWNFITPIVEKWLKLKFNFTYSDFKPETIEGPVLVAINHTCAYDPIFIGAAFKGKPLNFICSEHLLRVKTWGPFLDKYCWLIPHQKGARGSRTALVAMKRIKRGASVFLAVEGEQTWDGLSLPVMPYTGKLVKGSGATLITYMLEGAYLSAPRWSMSTRKGKVYGHPVNVYSPETLKEMSDEEVEAVIAKDLWFDTWEWQKTRQDGPVIYKCKEGGNAGGLERAVFSCPSCGAFGTLSSQDDSIGCSCGFKARMSDTGFFEPAEPFETIVDWEKLDRKALAERMEAMKSGQSKAADETDLLFADDNVILYHIKDDHEEEEAACGRLTLRHEDGEFILSIGEHRFSLADISNMTMVLAARVVFSDKNGYYELRAQKGSVTNLRKYVIARELIKE